MPSFDLTIDSTSMSVQRRTSFATVSVREYDQTIGDSPSCLKGAPITLGWSFRERQNVQIDDYEKARQPYRRQRSDLVLGARERRVKLIECGLPLSDIMRAESFSSLMMRSSLKEGNGKGVKTETNLPNFRELKLISKPTNQHWSSPPLRKQLASRAA
jgi:hypothetical protein